MHQGHSDPARRNPEPPLQGMGTTLTLLHTSDVLIRPPLFLMNVTAVPICSGTAISYN